MSHRIHDPVLQEVEDEALAELNAAPFLWDEDDPRVWEAASWLLLGGGSAALVTGWLFAVPWLGLVAMGGGFIAFMTSGYLLLGVLLQLLFRQRTLLEGLRGLLASVVSVVGGPVLVVLGLLLALG